MKWLLIIVAVLLTSCTDEEASRKALAAQGFTNIQFTGYSAFDCSDDDTFATGFRAKNPNGMIVDGTVCCGLFKKCTVRW